MGSRRAYLRGLSEKASLMVWVPDAFSRLETTFIGLCKAFIPEG